MLRLLAAQAAVAIEHAGLRARMETLDAHRRAHRASRPGACSTTSSRASSPARRRGEYPVAIAVLDLDHLGAFNMLRGEREGDRLIKETAALWRNELREVDMLARLDGGTFAAILPNCGLGEAIEVLDRVRAATPRDQTASAGVARWDGEEPSELLAGPLRGRARRGQAGRPRRHAAGRVVLRRVAP